MHPEPRHGKCRTCTDEHVCRHQEGTAPLWGADNTTEIGQGGQDIRRPLAAMQSPTQACLLWPECGVCCCAQQAQASQRVRRMTNMSARWPVKASRLMAVGTSIQDGGCAQSASVVWLSCCLHAPVCHSGEAPVAGVGSVCLKTENSAGPQQ